MGFDTFIPEIEEFEESTLIDTRPDTRGSMEHPDDKAQRLRHEDETHKQTLKHKDDTHEQNKRHREEAHKHNLKKAHENNFAYAPAVYAYGGPSSVAHFCPAGDHPNGPAGSGGTTTDTPSGAGAGGGAGSAGGAGGGAGGAGGGGGAA